MKMKLFVGIITVIIVILIDGRGVEDLLIGDSYGGSVIESLTMEAYQEDRTYDILPDGETGFYFANGILIGSSLKK